MSGAIPTAGTPFMRDFLYVDLGRTRSLLAQLYEGVPEKRETVDEKQRRWGGTFKAVFGLDAGRQVTEREQEQRALGDLHFAMLEDLAEATNYLWDISDIAQERDAWLSGELHSMIQDGQIVRISGPTQVFDPQQFASTIELLAGSPDTGAADPDFSEFAQMGRMIRDFMYGPGVFVRTMPFGVGEPEIAVNAILPTPSEYLPEPERAAILSRFGPQARDWTLVGQVARVSTNDTSDEPIEVRMAAIGQQFADRDPSSPRMNRGALESAMVAMLDVVEDMGLSEGPAWPGITVVPLAVYREVQPFVY